MDSILLMVNLSTLPFLSFLFFSFFYPFTLFFLLYIFPHPLLGTSSPVIKKISKTFHFHIHYFLIKGKRRRKGGGGKTSQPITFLIIIFE